MKISIIVPIYNVEAYLCKCIESIINQSHKDIEIILVDDGSADNSGIICDRYTSQDSRIITIHKSNEGVVSARKAGGRIASGEYIASVDGDDWIEETYIETFVKLIEKTGKDVIWSISHYKENEPYSSLCLADTKGNIDSIGCQADILGRVNGQYGFQNDIDYSICNKCIRKELYKLVQNQVSNNLTRGEDLYFSLVLLINTNSIFFCRNDGYHYVQRSASNTNDKNAYSKERFDLLERKLNELSNNLKAEQKSLNNIIKGYLLSTYMLYFFETMQDESLDYIYPFKEVKKNSSVVIFGAGSIGQNILSFLNTTNKVKVVAWIDSKITGYRLGKWETQPVNKILDLQYDFIILSTNRTMYIQEMQNTLRDFGIQDRKIVSPFDNR